MLKAVSQDGQAAVFVVSIAARAPAIHMILQGPTNINNSAGGDGDSFFRNIYM